MIRTTITISEGVYKKLVEMAIEKYKHSKAISKVIEDLVKMFIKKSDPKKIIENSRKLKIKVESPEKIDKIIEEGVLG